VGLTPWLTGAGARSAEGTDIGHENAEGMAYVGVRVEPPVRLGRAANKMPKAWPLLASTLNLQLGGGAEWKVFIVPMPAGLGVALAM
jgi:hypothetical protein